MKQKQLDLHKLVVQGYDGAATFSGKVGVQKRIHTLAAHQLSIQAAESVQVIKMMFKSLEIILLLT